MSFKESCNREEKKIQEHPLFKTTSSIFPPKDSEAKPKKKGFLDFRRLDEDFVLPNERWDREKTMGAGAYGKVMECVYKPLNETFAVKRFEQIADSE